MKWSICIVIHISLMQATSQQILVLGTAQDGGFPHIGCQKECQLAHDNPKLSRYVTSLALIDTIETKWWLFEATPDIADQLQFFQKLTGGNYPYLPEGIFLTHAHMGHYTGLMYLGKEALGTNNVSVFSLPRMAKFLNENGPWSQLLKLENIRSEVINPDVPLKLNDRLSIEAFTVPHRDEFSETAGFLVKSTTKSHLFIPDIDKWSKWDRDITSLVSEVDYAFLDATFFEEGELPNRAMAEVTHPFVSETMDLFKDQSQSDKAKVHFIHFNHTNPLLFDEAKKAGVIELGFNIAEQGKLYQ